MRLRPSDVSFTQNSICGRFQNNMFLTDTLKELLYRGKTPDDIPPIDVIQMQGSWWALTGNRRLYLYRKLEDLGIVETIPVVVRLSSERGIRDQLRRRMTTETWGKSIECRQRMAEIMMNDIIENWKKTQRNMSKENSKPLLTKPTVDMNHNLHFANQKLQEHMLRSHHLEKIDASACIPDRENSFERVGQQVTQIAGTPGIKAEDIGQRQSKRLSIGTRTTSDAPRVPQPLLSSREASCFTSDAYASRQRINPSAYSFHCPSVSEQTQISSHDNKSNVSRSISYQEVNSPPTDNICYGNTILKSIPQAEGYLNIKSSDTSTLPSTCAKLPISALSRHRRTSALLSKTEDEITKKPLENMREGHIQHTEQSQSSYMTLPRKPHLSSTGIAQQVPANIYVKPLSKSITPNTAERHREEPAVETNMKSYPYFAEIPKYQKGSSKFLYDKVSVPRKPSPVESNDANKSRSSARIGQARTFCVPTAKDDAWTKSTAQKATLKNQAEIIASKSKADRYANLYNPSSNETPLNLYSPPEDHMRASKFSIPIWSSYDVPSPDESGSDSSRFAQYPKFISTRTPAPFPFN